MLSLEIDAILKKDKICNKYYLGCFPADKIPTIFYTFPKCAVVNTDNSNEPGEHWVALFVRTPRHVEYFDPLGVWPSPSNHIQQFLSKFPYIAHNGGRQFQSTLSKVCGEFAVYFLHMRCKGMSFAQIMAKLSSTKTNPDILVKNFQYYLRTKY